MLSPERTEALAVFEAATRRLSEAENRLVQAREVYAKALDVLHKLALSAPAPENK